VTPSPPNGRPTPTGRAAIPYAWWRRFPARPAGRLPSVDRVLRHDLLRSLRAAATLIEKTRDVDVSGLTDDEYFEVDAVLTQIIQNAIRIRSRLTGPADQ
jgi:hypothetical protein